MADTFSCEREGDDLIILDMVAEEDVRKPEEEEEALHRCRVAAGVKAVDMRLRPCPKHFLEHLNFWKTSVKKNCRNVVPCLLYTNSKSWPSLTI